MVNVVGRDAAFAELSGHADLWRAGEGRAGGAQAHRAALPSGFPALDALLPAGGWPRGALTEILPEAQGTGELSLLLPALARITTTGRCVAWIAPPHIPYAPALERAGLDPARNLLVRCDGGAQALWAAEQSLRSAACGAVLLWCERADDRSLRRLQIAAQTGDAWAIVFRDRSAAAQFSPAALRVALSTPADAPGACVVEILKCRGGVPGGIVRLQVVACTQADSSPCASR